MDVWLIEDDSVYRQAIADLLHAQERVNLRRSFGSCEAAVDALATEDPPDLVLTDIGLPGMTGIDGARAIKSISPSTQIVMLTIHEDEDRIFDALCAGASGYLLKTASSSDILKALDEVNNGGVPFTAPIARKVLQIFSSEVAKRATYELTVREKEILRLLSEGLTQKAIAETLFVSPHTVDTHLRNIYAKLHVRNGIAAVSKASRERLI